MEKKAKIENLHLSEETQTIILKELRLDKLEDVMDKNYADFDVINDNDRKKSMFYSRRFRGSVRLNRGLFYTSEELEKRIKKVKELKLP